MTGTAARRSEEGLDISGEAHRTLVLGLGNAVLTDDGVGIHVVRRLDADADAGLPQGVTLRDGGTIGLGLLPEIADADALIVVDAAELHAAPGSVRVFEGAEMDARVGRSKGSAHEIALSDVMTAAAISGSRPERRALIAIQPENLSWGTEPTDAVAAAIPQACAAIAGLVDKWTR
ncbi:hydrogenase maturation protease [Rhodobium orientis]|uniref:Peptidase M52 n=1 Tax=Rhodobium orientis TaxID=34017 RepID=A0A327JYD4_9HYPH|nr:hydrogenase maturation protease [Rhodobium orientis]MBB4301245.1 hydrogenase maturation protease [Rhodobium orientis]MBK5951163.1 hypothetical protein [Rhodobium orientis]RAI29992.1 hypothetical protein CH339_00190 [Rhodobium orientis]